jgi:hypothetical protein
MPRSRASLVHRNYNILSHAALGVTDQMRKHRGSFDFILDAVSAEHDINAIQLLRRDNTHVTGMKDFGWQGVSTTHRFLESSTLPTEVTDKPRLYA